MTGHRSSYLKTLGAAAALGAVVLAALRLLAEAPPGILRLLVQVIAGSALVILAGVWLGGLLALYRDVAQAKGRRDLFDASNESRSERALAAGDPGAGIRLRRAWRRLVGGRWLLVGDEVEIRSSGEIAATLDDSGCLDGLPFMPEMAAFCGRRARVFRCVDKIYDYGRSKKLRRLDAVVLLGGFRCDGSAHGGCQASCYLLWKRAWLRPAEPRRAGERVGALPPRTSQKNPRDTDLYSCQYTQLASASRSMRRWDVRQDLRPLAAGNVTVSAFWVALLTRLFNAAQGARGGVQYPSMMPGPASGLRPVERGLAPGDTVRVRTMEDIAATLDQGSRHRGLWFDRDMVKHCGRRYGVLRRVERIIDDATGRMLEMKTPCVVLAGAEASGEYLRFCAQHEYPFWREAWLSLELE